MSKNKLFLLDAMALLYRAHFAFIRNPRITSKGMNTSAMFGFCNTLLEIVNKEDPTHLAVAFDTSAPTFRHIAYEPYKAQREAMPEDLAKAIPYAYKLLEILKIPALVLDGYEADDIIGTISAQIDENEFEVYMVTPDKDYAQLVKDNVFLYRPRSRGGGFQVMGIEEVKEAFGIPPSQIIDFLGLKGDAVDNIPGVPKVGDKTAVALLTEYGSVENIIANVDNITKKAVAQSLRDNAEQGLMSKELATIKLDVPYEWTPEELKVEHCELDQLMELMGELEFKTTTKRFLTSKFNPVKIAVQEDLFGNQVGDGPNLPDDFGKEEMKILDKEKIDYQEVKTAEDRKKVIDKIKAAGEFCFDTETTGLDAMNVEIVGLALSTKSGEGFYQHFPEDWSEDQVKEVLGEFQGVLLSKDILKIGQNLKYDILVLKNYGIEVDGPMFDTMLAHYVIKPGAKHNMDALSEEYLNYQPVSITTLIGKKGAKQKSMRDVEVEKLIDYASEDADITLRLKEKLAPEVKESKIFNEIEQPLMPVLAAMEFEGIKLDKEALEDYSVDLEGRLQTLEKEIYTLADAEFNINSPRQLGEILFDKLGLGKGEKQKKTKTGQYVTDEKTLSGLAYTHEL
ncbi:MAG: DNA polymerase, partial [Bacteroidota bacterium]